MPELSHAEFFAFSIFVYVKAGYPSSQKCKANQFFAEFKSMKALGEFIHMMRDKNYKIYDVEINRSKDTVEIWWELYSGWI